MLRAAAYQVMHSFSSKETTEKRHCADIVTDETILLQTLGRQILSSG